MSSSHGQDRSDQDLICLIVFVIIAGIVVSALIISNLEGTRTAEPVQQTTTAPPPPQKSKRERVGEYVGDSSRKFIRGMINGVKNERKND